MRLLSKSSLLSLLLLNMAVGGCGGSAGSGGNTGVTIEVFHADSLAGPMKQLKNAFEAKNKQITVNLTTGRSKELAERIMKGDTCDVFAPSDPLVTQGMMGKLVDGKEAAPWYITFSANELVVITNKGNSLGIKKMADLANEGVKLARVVGEKDMATNRSLAFIQKAATAEGKPELAQRIIEGAHVKAETIPDAVQAVKSGQANAAVVYLSAAVAAGDEVEIISFPASVNLSADIRNVVTVPGTAKNGEAANSFVKFILSTEGQEILKKTGQPPIVPPIKEGNVPVSII